MQLSRLGCPVYVFVIVTECGWGVLAEAKKFFLFVSFLCLFAYTLFSRGFCQS